MACTPQTFNGLARNCDANSGGVRVVYIANRSDVATVSLSEDKIGTITMADTKKFHAYNFKKGAASLTSTATIDPATGANFVTSVLSMRFAKMETTKRIEMSALTLADMVVIVLDNNGKYWFLGYDNYAYATNATGETGAQRTDANQYTIEISDESEGFPYEVDPTIIADIVAA